MAAMLDIDGSYLEGGGQILRTACALSAVTGTPCRIFNIRKGRPRPGLRTQHLAGIEALAFFSGGRLEGAFQGSTEITFSPGAESKAELSVVISTAGSITLALQSLLPAAVMAPAPVPAPVTPVTIEFRGGATDTFFAPSLDYCTEVFLATLGMIGVRAEVEAARRGYYPKGGAQGVARIFPSRPGALSLTERGTPNKILLLSRASASLKARSVAERQAAGARQALGKADIPVEERISYHDSSCPGSSICLVAVYENSRLGADGLGKIGKRAEDVGREAARSLLGEMASGACLDRHMADQVLPFMALSGRECSVTVSEVTTHARTNMWVTEKFIQGKFEVRDGLVRWSPA